MADKFLKVIAISAIIFGAIAGLPNSVQAASGKSAAPLVGDGRWPGMGVLQVIGPDGEKILVERRTEFARSRPATFKYKKAADDPACVSLYTKEHWY